MPGVLAVRALALVILTLVGACADEDEPVFGQTDPCVLPQAALLGCPPPQVTVDLPAVEAVCQKLVDCNVIPLDDGPDSTNDWFECVARLEDNERDRLEYSLRCIEVSTCIDLRDGLDGPCFIFGREP